MEEKEEKAGVDNPTGAQQIDPILKSYSQEEYDAKVRFLTEEAAASQKEALHKQFKTYNRKLSIQGQKIKDYEEKPKVHSSSAINSILDELGRVSDDPEVKERVTRAKQVFQKSVEDERLEAQFLKQQAIITSEREAMTEKIIDAGFDPNLENFDVVHDLFDTAADKTGDFTKANERCDKVLSRLVANKEKESKVVDETKVKTPEPNEQSNAETAKAEAYKILKDAGYNLESVDLGGGVGGDSDTDFNTLWAEGKLPDTPANVKRARKLAGY